jgi:ABC-type uncharacterized transport system substrate-binding protein
MVGEFENLYPTSEELGITLVRFPVDDNEDLKSKLNNLEKNNFLNIDAILMLPGTLDIDGNAVRIIADFAEKNKIPFGGSLIAEGENNSIFTFINDFLGMGQQSAIMADKILNGAFAGDIPFVPAATFLQINYKFLKQIGLDVNDDLMIRADDVIR